MGSFGYSRPTTPVLDRLGGQSVVWERCLAADLAASSATRILLTGSLTRGVAGSSADPQSGVPVDGTLTLAEFARQSGMRTAAMFAAQKEPLLALGFEHYDKPRKKRRSADKVTQRALKWLNADSKSPTFVWVNYGDLLRETPVDNCLGRMLPGDEVLDSWVSGRWVAPGAGPASSELAKRVGVYDQNLRLIDLQIGELLDGLCKMDGWITPWWWWWGSRVSL
jgi:hypothetical protein